MPTHLGCRSCCPSVVAVVRLVGGALVLDNVTGSTEFAYSGGEVVRTGGVFQPVAVKPGAPSSPNVLAVLILQHLEQPVPLVNATLLVRSGCPHRLLSHLFQFLDLQSGQAFGFGTRGIQA